MHGFGRRHRSIVGQRHCLEAGFINPRGNGGGIGLGGIETHLRFFSGKIHPGFQHRGFFVQHFFNAAGTGLASHAVDMEADFLFHDGRP